jgi:hypothetical protein
LSKEAPHELDCAYERKKIKKKFQNHRRLSIINGSVLEFEARRSPYLESSSIITCGGPRYILAEAALRLR